MYIHLYESMHEKHEEFHECELLLIEHIKHNSNTNSKMFTVSNAFPHLGPHRHCDHGLPLHRFQHLPSSYFWAFKARCTDVRSARTLSFCWREQLLKHSIKETSSDSHCIVFILRYHLHLIFITTLHVTVWFLFPHASHPPTSDNSKQLKKKIHKKNWILSYIYAEAAAIQPENVVTNSHHNHRYDSNTAGNAQLCRAIAWYVLYLIDGE